MATLSTGTAPYCARISMSCARSSISTGLSPDSGYSLEAFLKGSLSGLSLYPLQRS